MLQSYLRSSLTMLPLAVGICHLTIIISLVLVAIFSGISKSEAFLAEFFTQRHNSKRINDEEAFITSWSFKQPTRKNLRGHFKIENVRNVDWSLKNHYRLRFRPAELFQYNSPFWQRPQKPQQQINSGNFTEEPELSAPTTIAFDIPEEENIEPTTTPIVDDKTMSSVTTLAPIAPTEGSMLESSTSLAPSQSMHPFLTNTTTTISTIMRPFNRPSPPNQLGSSSSDTLQQLVQLFGSPLEANLIEKQQAVSRAPPLKSKGFLSLFEVIKFENNKCLVAMSDIRTLEGICYHEFECKSLGGVSTRRCAEGVGVCCVFLTSCGDATNQPIVYFESPNYPNAVREMLICVLVVDLRKRVQQLRLDFLMFELNRPTNGDCIDDQFIVSGQDINFVVPALCGINTGQHIYVDVGNSLDRKIYLSFFAKVATGARSFNIQISQLENDLAPDGCLQYYTDDEGIIKSFNYDIDGALVDNPVATYLNNLNYAVCLRRAKDACSVRYVIELLSGDQLDFQLINKDEAENDLVPDGQAGAGIFNCPDDFIAINQVRLCGERLNDGTEIDDFSMNAPVKDNAAGPIILPVRSDDEYVGRGFRLVYKQEPCI